MSAVPEPTRKDNEVQFEDGQIVELESGWYELMDDALGKLQYHKARLAMLTNTFAVQKARIEEKIAFHEQNLRVAATFGRTAMGSTIDAPHGRVTLRTAKGKFVVSDVKAALAYSEKHEIPVRVKREVMVDALRPQLQEREGGELVDTKTGEIIPWAKVEGKGEVSVSYKFAERES